MLGRGGLIVPPDDFLPRLRELCDGRSTVLILDEIYTGMGRTGAWFACEHVGVVPDLLVVGKGLTGSIALSAAIGSPAVMAAWPPSTGEAIHTSTFLGNPIACAAALAQLDEIESRGLVARAAELGNRIRDRALAWQQRFQIVEELRGRGLLQGVRLAASAGERPAALQLCDTVLQRGVILLAEGPAADVLALTPPAVITEDQLDTALEIIGSAIEQLDGARQ
jgi:4-aminobutyrate aminotransferase / (S)-3-amino-2-methylpropionate transaminase / 5-aminovalerate transaminase